MADYKELLGKLADKVKDAAESSGVMDVYAQGANRARAFGQLTKLTVELSREQEELKRIYAEIGQLYYEQHTAAPEGVFVPLFERCGKISEVDKYVWSQAARQIARWQVRFGKTIPVSVNLSRVDVFDPALEKNLKDRDLSPKIITGHTGWTDNFEFVFRHRDKVCNSLKKQKPHDPSAPYDGYKEDDDTEENARKNSLPKVIPSEDCT